MRHVFFSRKHLAVCLLLGAAQLAPAQTLDAPEKRGPFVRPFSAGGTVGLLVQQSLPSANLDQTVAEDLTISSSTTSKRYTVGGGFVMQWAFKQRWSLSTGLTMRLQKFQITDITIEGIDDEDTAEEERIASSASNSTRARLMDIPLLLRRYSKDHSKPGRRLFYEGGMAVRNVRGIRSFRQSTASDGTETCCDESPMTPAKRWLPGVVAGVGVQFIDDYGIRFVPEIRYTRWMGRTFDAISAQSQKNQVEVILSFTF